MLTCLPHLSQGYIYPSGGHILVTRRHYIHILDSYSRQVGWKSQLEEAQAERRSGCGDPQHGRPAIGTHHPDFLEPAKRDTQGLSTYLSTLTHRELLASSPPCHASGVGVSWIRARALTETNLTDTQ